MAGRYKPYPEYKDSGIEWLGEIPSIWMRTSLKRYCRVTDGSHHSPEIQSSGEPFVSVTDVGTNKINFEDCKRISHDQYLRLTREGCKPSPGDILLTKDGTIGRAVIVKDTDPEFVILSSLGLLSPSSFVFSTYLYYFLVSGINIDQMNSLIHGSALRRMTVGKINSLVVLVPAMKEQETIANFLDHEIAKIDTLIEKQQQLIQLLNEKRQAVISHAVTKGLTPSAKMRDSGVDWLGNVPESWTICRIKQVARLESGHTPDKKIEAYWVDCDIPWVSLNDSSQLKEVDYISDTAFYLNEKGIANSSARKLPERCVVFTRDASIGLAAITTRVMAVSQHLIAWICNEEKVIPEYLLLVFYAMEDELERYTLGATLKTIGMPDVNKLTAAFPNIEEQKQIIDHVFKAREKFDLLIAKAEYAIKIIKERRTALISAAVTGKIDVRNWITPKETQTNKEVVA